MNKIEIFYGSLSDKKPRNLFVEDIESAIGHWSYRAQKFKTELYCSLFAYDRHITQHKEYNGNIYLRDEIILDIDKTEHIDEVEKELEKYSSYDLYTSGTGYHIHMPSTLLDIKQDRDTPMRVRDIFYSIFKDKIDLIYDKQRLIRMKNTINKKNGKHKELLKQVKSDNQKTLTSNISFPISNIIVKENVEYTEIENINRLCIKDILVEPVKKGTRHQNILRIVGALREQGYSKELITETLLKKYEDDTMSINEIETMIETAERYTYGCNDIVMKTRCHEELCTHYIKPVNIEMVEPEPEKKDIYTLEEIEPVYIDYITNPNNNQLNLKYYLDLEYDYIIRGGEFVVVIGDTKVGKTAFVQNLTMYAKYNAERILYISLEVGKELLFRRFIQIENDMTKKETDHAYKNKTEKLNLIQDIKHVSVMTEAKTLRELDNIIKNYSLVIVDTIDGVKEYGESIQRIERIALGLKELAVKHNIIIIGIHHISKHILDAVTGKVKPLTLHSGKGSSSVEQKADKVIGVENYFVEGEEPGNKMVQKKKVTSLAARDEQNFTKIVEINFETFKLNTK